jgi:SAM-dependent methyltransferase
MTEHRAHAIVAHYDTFYRDRDPLHVYPVEFVVRALLGNYPRLSNEAARCEGKKVVDLGFGDGRNMPLLHNLGMELFGVEISAEICRLTEARMQRLGIPITLRVGRNHTIPFADADFDYVLACHSCYYVEPGTKFSDNVREIARVLKPGGKFVFSVPMASTYIMHGARDLGDGHMEITNDPYNVRNGYILKQFETENEIQSSLSPHFQNFAIGACRNDFWGIEEHMWIVVCRRS